MCISFTNKLYFVVPSPNIQGVINLLKGSLNARRHKIVVSSSSRSIVEVVVVVVRVGVRVGVVVVVAAVVHVVLL